MSSMPKKIDPELRARAVRLVAEHRAKYPTETAAVVAVAKQLSWACRGSRCGAGKGRPGWMPVTGLVSLPRTTLRSRSSKRRTSGCGRTSISSALQRFSSRGNSTPATADHRVHRPDEKRRPRGPCRPAGSCESRAARSPRGPTGPCAPATEDCRPGPSPTPRPSRRSARSRGSRTPTAGADWRRFVRAS